VSLLLMNCKGISQKCDGKTGRKESQWVPSGQTTTAATETAKKLKPVQSDLPGVQQHVRPERL